MGFRSNDAIINEAELLASPSERVADWLKSRAQTVSLYFAAGDEALELALLRRGDSLIDITLAQFGLYDATLKELFSRSVGEGESPFRLAVLSNAAAAKFSLRFPFNIIGDREDEALAQLSPHELAALFGNAELADSFIQNFLEQKGGWSALDDRKQRTAIGALAKNLSVREEWGGHWDGFGAFLQNAVFDRAWQLANVVPATPEWADILGRIYSEMAPRAHSMEAPLQVAARWRPDPADAETSNSNGFLVPRQVVRFGLARLALHKAPKRGEELLGDDDVAVRCAAYSLINMSTEHVRAAFERDGKVGARYMLKNITGIWRQHDPREELREVCWDATKERPGDLSLPEDFDRQSQELEERYPQWFEARWDDDDEPSPPAPDPVLTRLDQLQNQIDRQKIALFLIVLGVVFLVLR